jgi:hypothetical protein
MRRGGRAGRRRPCSRAPGNRLLALAALASVGFMLAALGIEPVVARAALATLTAFQLLASVGPALLPLAGVEIQRRYTAAALARDPPPGPSVP